MRPTYLQPQRDSSIQRTGTPTGQRAGADEKKANAWERALTLTSESSASSFKSQGAFALCRICERNIAARHMAEHTRRCVLASQVLQEAETCDARLSTLASKLAAKIDERRRLAAAAHPDPPSRPGQSGTVMGWRRSCAVRAR